MIAMVKAAHLLSTALFQVLLQQGIQIGIVRRAVCRGCLAALRRGTCSRKGAPDGIGQRSLLVLGSPNMYNSTGLHLGETPGAVAGNLCSKNNVFAVTPMEVTK